MPKDEGLESAVGKARTHEENYDWLGAIELHRKALDLVSEPDFLKIGQVQERIGYDFYRAGMQAESVEEFRDRMRQVVASYERAKEFYRKPGGQREKPRTIRCDAMIAYAGYWLASDVPEKNRLLGDCWRLTKESLKAFKEADDALEYGMTYNQLSGSSVLGFCFDWDFEARETLMREAVEHGEQAIKFLSACEEPLELARAYARTTLFLGVFDYYFIEPYERAKASQRVQDYWRKAEELSEETALLEVLYPVVGAQVILWGDATDKAKANLEKALEYARKSRDKFITGCAFDWLTYHVAWTRWTIEDPEERSRVAKTVLQYAEDAEQQYSSISFTSPRDDAYGVELRYAEHYYFSAFYETDSGKKHSLLEKAKEVASDGLKRAKSSEYPELIGYTHHFLCNTLASLYWTVKDSEKRRQLLEEALEHGKESVRIIEQFGPFQYWDRGIEDGNIAAIKSQLAHFARDPETKKHILEESILDKEKALKLCIQGAIAIGTPAGTSPFLGMSQYRIGADLNRLYELTDNKEHLRKAAKAFAEATEFFQKANLNGRVAECHWKAAQTYDTLSQHLDAGKIFESASESYRLAAEKIPQLSGFYQDYASYMRAWAEIEKSRHERENENYAKSRLHYRLCSSLLKMSKKWSYLSSYYFAWSVLDHGETLSRMDKPQEAIKAFNEAGRIFGDSANSFREKVGELDNSEEREEASKLAEVAGLRRQYCLGRVLMEEAMLSDRKGDRVSSAMKYSSAAVIFDGIAPNLEREEAREDLRFAAAICEAWKKMELAEERGDAALYKIAAKLFAKASEISRRKTAELTAMGNGCFCEALEMGMKFMATSNMDFYSAAKSRMESAAGYYQRAGFEKPTLWVEATKRLFDAYVYVGKAEAEAEPEKRVKFYLMAQKCLELAAKFYGKAGYSGKKNEVLRNLERVRKERELAFSLSEVLAVPAVLSSTTRVSMPDLTEKAAGLDNFESANIRAIVSVPNEFVPGQEFEVNLDLANVGKRTGLLVRIEDIVPPRCKVMRCPSYCTLEGTSLNMRGRRLDPLSVESVSIWVQVADVVSIVLSPLVVYVDELGDFRTTKVEKVKILPVVEFESKVAQVVFNYLVDSFIEDCVKQRLGVAKSGWRSFPQIMKGAGVSKRSLYGAGGRWGHGLSELQRKGLVHLETFLGERGRGGHILRVRIYHEKELIKRYFKEKAPDLST